MQCNAMSRMNGTVPYAWVHSSVVQQWSLAVPTLDAFQLLHDAQKHGARAALFGRKINQAENQLAFVETLRHVAGWHRLARVGAYRCALAQKVRPRATSAVTSCSCVTQDGPKRRGGGVSSAGWPRLIRFGIYRGGLTTGGSGGENSLWTNLSCLWHTGRLPSEPTGATQLGCEWPQGWLAPEYTRSTQERPCCFTSTLAWRVR